MGKKEVNENLLRFIFMDLRKGNHFGSEEDGKGKLEEEEEVLFEREERED